MKKSNKIKFDIIIIIAIILFTIATVPKTLQEDTFYMIKVGEYITQNGMSVIDQRIEPFGWVDGLIYTYPHWLLDVIFYGLYNTFDYAGIYVFTLAVGIITYLLMYYTNIKVAKNRGISAVLTLMAVYFLSGFIAARAQIITFFCLVLEVLFIERFLETGKKRYLIGLVLDPILLANCHAALFPIYFVVFLPYLAEYILALLRKNERYNRKIKHLEKRELELKDDVKEEPDPKLLEKYKQKLEKVQLKLAKVKEKLARYDEKTKLKNEICRYDSKIYIEKNNRVKWLCLIFVVCIFTGLLTPIKDIPYVYMYKSIVRKYYELHFRTPSCNFNT